jgi:hypothetical protein
MRTCDSRFGPRPRRENNKSFQVLEPTFGVRCGVEVGGVDMFFLGGGGTNLCDEGLDLSGSWQQGHSATYNAPSRI